MSVYTQAFLALSRTEIEEFLMKVVSSLDDQSLKLAVHTLTTSYNPLMLKEFNHKLPAKKIRTLTQTNVAKQHEPCVSVKLPYVPPPRVRDAEKFWPYMRCKNVARALHRAYNYSKVESLPRSHHGLLVYLASLVKIDVEKFKNTSPKELFKNNPYVSGAIGYNSYLYC